MAGQRMYYSNVQTNTRGSVQLTTQINFDGTGTPSIVNGAGYAITGSGATSVFTISIPERFAAVRVHKIAADFLQGTTLASLALVGAYTVPTVLSQQSSVPVSFVLQSNATATVTVSPKGTLFFSFEAALGM